MKIGASHNAVGGGEIEPTSGAVEAEQLCGPERAWLSEQLSVVWAAERCTIARDPD
jgi:hypothetical protein